MANRSGLHISSLGFASPSDRPARPLSSLGAPLTHSASCIARRALRPTPCAATAFTLIEMLLVMTIVVTAIGVIAPTLAGFFRGRTLDSEVRRMLSLTHSAQNRAISEGIPTRLWLDTAEHSYGVEQDPGWSDRDAKSIQFTFDQDLKIEVVHADAPRSSSSRTRLPPKSQAKANPRNLPEIRFLPDGSIDETSPRAFRLEDRSGTLRWLAQATNHLSYEIRDSFN